MLAFRYLEGSAYKNQEAYDAIMAHHTFLTTTYPLNPSLIAKYIEGLNAGVFYALKRDKSHRPIQIVNVKALGKLKLSEDDLCGMICFYENFLLTRAIIEGKIENWVIIMDMKGVGLTSMPKKQAKVLAKPLQMYYKGRLYRLYLVNASMVMKVGWKLAKKIVDPLTVLKFKLLGDKF
jgi:hypothetical protein